MNRSFLFFFFFITSALAQPHPWPCDPVAETLAERFEPPQGFERVRVEAGSFGEWLRNLPLKPMGAKVHLYNGEEKNRQDVHAAVPDIDVGSANLQQCADAVIRLFAEYQFSKAQSDFITFHFTSGDPAKWQEWKRGMRPVVKGNKVRWTKSAEPDSSYRNFRDYLDTVFQYAGTLSLSRELKSVENPAEVEPGDVFIQGGSPGHAVIVLDVARNQRGAKVFLIAQSYMPAQEIHVLRTPNFPRNAWYPARELGILETPEWTFRYSDLKRFP
jgi:hypothetical protein